MENTINLQNETRNQIEPRPFASPAAAADILECTPRRVADYIHDATIPLSFDIRHPEKTRLCLRLATTNVVAFKSHLNLTSDAQKFFDTVFPRECLTYSPSRLAWILDCGEEHIYHLIADKALADAGGETRHKVPRESVIRFLMERRVA